LFVRTHARADLRGVIALPQHLPGFDELTGRDQLHHPANVDAHGTASLALRRFTAASDAPLGFGDGFLAREPAMALFEISDAFLRGTLAVDESSHERR
jgi:hypothetical protein